MDKKLAIGIDLGTYNSCAAFAEDVKHVKIIKNQHGPTIQGQVFPSFIRFDALGNIVAYGEDARLQMVVNPDRVVWGTKRLIGRSWHQIEKEVTRYAYPLAQSPDGKVVIPIGNIRYTPAEISTFILQWIKASAETFNPTLVGQIGKAVITHPAYFDASQIEETKEAAKRAGFDEVELIAEPVAAAIAYGIQLNASSPQFIMAIDWGAGTLDIAVIMLKIGSKGQPILAEARPARGDVALGGIDMDDLLLVRAMETYNLKEFQSLVSKTVRSVTSLETELEDMFGGRIPPQIKDVLGATEKMPPAEQNSSEADNALWGEFYQLRSWLEQSKIELSRLPATRGWITYQGQTVAVKMARTRQDCLDGGKDWIILEEVLRPLLDVFQKQVEFAIKKSGLGSTDIQHVLLVGGPMHIPCVRKVVQDIFAGNPNVTEELNKIEKAGFPVNPMEAVARGAALFAGHAGPDPTIKRIPFDYGVIFGSQGDILIQEGAVVPCEAAFPGELSAPGHPGAAVPLGLYKREVGPEGESFTRIGDFEFVATVSQTNGMLRFLPQLRAEEDKTVSLEIKDLVSGDTLQLKRLSILVGRKIAKPAPFFSQDVVDDTGRVGKTGGIAPPPRTLSVDPQLVAMKRNAALSAIAYANAALGQDPNVQSKRGLKKELDEKVKALEDALKGIHVTGQTDDRSYQKLANRYTELVVLMMTEKIITEADLKF